MQVTAEAPVPMLEHHRRPGAYPLRGRAWSEQDVASFFTPFAFPSKDPSDLGLDLLVAFFIAYHHGGDLLVHQAAPEGPGLSCCCR